jgi:hypothetical protein
MKPESTVISGHDNDAAGHRYAAIVRELVAAAGQMLTYERHLPRRKDFGQDLIECTRPEIRHMQTLTAKL